MNHTTHRANDEIWTRDLFLTKEALYPWATPALKQKEWAGDEIRTRDVQLGRLTLYQLSYSRLFFFVSVCGESRIRTCEGVHQQIYSLPSLAAWVSPQHRADGGIRTPDQLITNQLLWPTELHRQMIFSLNKERFFKPKPKFRIANIRNFFVLQSLFQKILPLFI